MTTLPSKTFCAFPFTHLVTHNAGTYGPCCGASEHFFVDENNKVESNKMFDSVLSTSIKPYGLGIEEAFNSEPMDATKRESVLQGINRAVVFQRSLNITNAIIDDLNRQTPPPRTSDNTRRPVPGLPARN